MYRHKTQAKAKYVTILYTNLSKNNIIITPGQILAHGSMCCSWKKDKSLINAVKTENKNKTVTDQLCYVRKKGSSLKGSWIKKEIILHDKRVPRRVHQWLYGNTTMGQV